MSVETKKRVILVNPPNPEIVLRDMYSSTVSKGSYNWPCIDLLVISGILRNKYDVKLIDANTLGYSLSRSVEEICRFNPDVICFAFGCSVKNADYAFVKVLRNRLPEARIIGTGGLLYHNAEKEMLAHPEFDAVLLNFTTGDIIKYIENDFSGLRNMVYRSGGDLLRAQCLYPENGFSYPLPLHEQLPLPRYRMSNGKRRPLSSVLTSYGCPWACAFCVSERIDYRYRDPLNVLEELLYLQEIGVKEVVFRDNTFYAHPLQGRIILEGMIRRKIHLSWVAETRADCVNEEKARLMKAAGCHSLHIGVETGSAEILRSMNKSISRDDLFRAFKTCRDNGIVSVGYFILGFPNENTEGMRATIRLARELECDYASFNVMLPIYGTSFREKAQDNGWLRETSWTTSSYDGAFASLLRAPGCSKSDIAGMISRAYFLFYCNLPYARRALSRCRNIYQIEMLFCDFLYLLRYFFRGKSYE
ncbi:MAG: B12-binding domain-containing radical SAM protein [Candidatus Omnitrophota bacterium]